MAKGGWEIVLLGSGPQGEAIVNTFHWLSDVDEAASPTIASNLCDSFETTVLPAFRAAVTEDWAGFHIMARCLYGPNLDQEFTKSIVGADGDLAGPSAPLQTCAIIRRRSGAIGKHGRGRLFISPIPRTWVDVNGKVDDGGVVLPDLAAACITDLVSLEGTYKPCLHNINAGGIVGLTVLTHTDVSSLAGVMRSRRVRFPN